MQAKVEDRSQLRIRWCITARLALGARILCRPWRSHIPVNKELTRDTSVEEVSSVATKLDKKHIHHILLVIFFFKRELEFPILLTRLFNLLWTGFVNLFAVPAQSKRS